MFFLHQICIMCFGYHIFFVLGMGHVIQGFLRLLPDPRQKVHEKGLA